MEQKIKLDLSMPPPPPGASPPPEPKKPEKSPQKPQKRGGLAVGILLGVVAAAAVLFCGYRFVHFWSDASCIQKAKCGICGIEQGDYAAHDWNRGGNCSAPATCAVCGQQQAAPAGHDWTGGSCTEPKVCAVCGIYEDQASGHSYAGGSCTVCGAAQVNEVLKWESGDYAEVEHTYRSATGELSIRSESWEKLPKMTLVVQDWQGNEVSTDCYTVTRTEMEAVLNFPDDLAPGRYTIYAGVQRTLVAEFWFGTAGAWMPVEADRWRGAYQTKNWQHGLYLAASEEAAPLRGVQTQEEATRFDTPWQMSAVAITEDGTAVLAPGINHQKFVMDVHLCVNADGAEETAYTFGYRGWYLAMDSEGTVFLTESLNDSCYWIITDSL